MNTLEKRKLESIITSTLGDARTAYQQRRNREHEALVRKFEKNVPPQVQKLVKKCKDAKAEYTRKAAELSTRKAELDKEDTEAVKVREASIDSAAEEATKLGYKLSNYRHSDEVEVSLAYATTYTGRYNNTAVRTYTEPTLTAYEKETIESIQKLDDMASEYAIAVWADNGDMGALLDRFSKDVRQLTA